MAADVRRRRGRAALETVAQGGDPAPRRPRVAAVVDWFRSNQKPTTGGGLDSVANLAKANPDATL